MYRYFTDLDFRWAIQGGLKMLSIRSNRHESFPLLSIRHTGSRFPRRDSVRIELRRNVRIVKCLRRIDSAWVYRTWMEATCG